MFTNNDKSERYKDEIDNVGIKIVMDDGLEDIDEEKSEEAETGDIKNEEKLCEVNAVNILDANALAMYNSRFTKRSTTIAVRKTDEISQNMDRNESKKTEGTSGQQNSAEFNNSPSVKKSLMDAARKTSTDTGLVGVIAAGQKTKKSSNKKFGVIARHLTKLPEKVLYARSSRGALFCSKIPVTGGEPINEELAVELRTVAFGSAGCPPRGEWTRTALVLRPPNQLLAYGLTAPRNGCRGLLAALGAHVLKHLLFGTERPRDAQGKLLQTDMLMRPDDLRQQEALVYAIAEVIWRASGETKKAFIVIPQDVVYVQHSHNYYQDAITEKLHIFEFHNLEDVQIFIKRYLYMFDEEPGCGTMLLLYSCMLTRGLTNIKKDLDGRYAYLVSSQVEGSINVVMLLLTGRATPYLHNGVIYVGDEDHYALPQYGVLARSSIGLLEWRGSDDHQDNEYQPPGSRLKTPALPIWVTFCAGHFGMLFNTNRELLRNYHAERRFDLQ